MEKDHIILKPIAEPRKGWDKAFKVLHENGDYQLLMEDIFQDEDIKTVLCSDYFLLGTDVLKLFLMFLDID